MAPTFAALNAMTDEELIEQHDIISGSTAIGLNFYRDELYRRSAERVTAAALDEACAARKLAVWNMVVAVVAVMIAAATIVTQIALSTLGP